ncbi:Integrase core domain protein [Tepidimonas alkaliphilus]|uniref:Integrase core domain protein n=1 Tax=Tepidimonas alkaliphilus TaxID=2588942 RepID=A0A554W4L1_9BURK|nr:Integrase core domain protein [Tepidimonas alkaliphilus]
MGPDDLDRRVSHETIDNGIDAMPRGELRKEIIASLRRAQSKRMPCSRGQDRRGQLPEAVSIHLRPPEANERAFPGHWEGDLLKGAANRSAVGVLVERSSRLVCSPKLKDATAASALEDFTAKPRKMPKPMRKTLTYDRGKEMARHPELTEATGIRVDFCDPRSPWQRGSCENRLRFHPNINGLLRQVLPKGTDLSVCSQEELDAIADRLNNRPRAIHGFYPPIAVDQAMLEKLTQASHSLQ